MTQILTPQVLSVTIILAMMAAFIWGRYRYDVIAIAGLLAGIAAGIVPADKAFSGFSDDIVIIVGSALIVSAGVARSGIMDRLVQQLAPNISNVRIQLALLVGIVALLSAVIKNIGALAIMMPIAFQFARRSAVPASVFLMPMAFASLLGGLMTLIGTSPNIVVSRVREELTGMPFRMFDYTAVGALLTLVGVAFLVAFSWLLLPHRQRTEGALADAIAIKNYTVEASIEPESASAGKTVSELLQLAGGSVTILSILKNGSTEVKPLPDVRLGAGDTLVLEGDNESIDRLASLASLGLTGRRQLGEQDAESSELAAVEAVVGEQSALVGSSAQDLQLFDTHRINVLAVSRKNHRLKQKLGQVRLRAGDVLVLQGSSARLPEFLRNMGLLPLVERNLQMGLPKNGGLAIAILGAAMALTALALVPVAVAFFAAAVLMVLTGIIPLRDMYRSVEGPILVMLAALIPVSDALRSTGVTDIIAQRLAEAGTGLPSYAAVALIMVAAMAVTPFLNNAATVLVMAPIAAQFAGNLGYKPEAFLLAVAIGAGCDFLTPVGHQCNTLVMAPGGYRFSDYARLGLPLSVLVVLIAVPSLMWFWAL